MTNIEIFWAIIISYFAIGLFWTIIFNVANWKELRGNIYDIIITIALHWWGWPLGIKYYWKTVWK
jgi:hypothetical protein